MCPQLLSLATDELSAGALCGFGTMVQEKVAIVSFDETGFHGILPRSLRRHVTFAKPGSDLRFLHPAKREEAARKQGGRKSPEEITLVLRRVNATKQEGAPRCVGFCSDIVSRRHQFTSLSVCPLLQQAKFEASVAVYAGIRRSARQIFLQEICHDIAAELLPDIHRDVADLESLSQAACCEEKIRFTRKRTGLQHGFVQSRKSRRGELSGQIKDTHGQAHDLVTLFLEHAAHGGTVRSARHGDHDL